MKVYEVVGWFGDREWSEGLWMKEVEAEAYCAERWKTRTSDHAPDYCQGVCKFGVEEREVIE